MSSYKSSFFMQDQITSYTGYTGYTGSDLVI